MPAPKSPAFAAAYIRVSTDDQAELSPESQLVEIQLFKLFVIYFKYLFCFLLYLKSANKKSTRRVPFFGCALQCLTHRPAKLIQAPYPLHFYYIIPPFNRQPRKDDPHARS